MSPITSAPTPATESGLAEEICEAASDYKCGLRFPEFAQEYGGIDALRDTLFDLVEKWEGVLEDV